MLRGIGSASRNYFLGLVFPSRRREFAGTGDGADFLAYTLPLFLALDILPESNDVPVAILLNTTILTRST
jgi:hypothetical protein